MKKIIFFIILFFLALPVQATTTKVLESDTYLHPQGWASGELKFKANTPVIFNDQNEVISGTICQTQALRTAAECFGSGELEPKNNIIRFKDNSSVTFNERGEVISGTPIYTCNAKLVEKKGHYVRFKKHEFIAFNNDGSIAQGILDHDTCLRPLNWKKYLPINENAGFLKFKADLEVFFGPDGQVAIGVIAEDFVTLDGKQYKAGDKLKFDSEQIIKL